MQIYHQKKEAHEQELMQQQAAASVLQHEGERGQHSRPQAADVTLLLEIQPGLAEPQLPSQHHGVQQMTVKEQEPQVPLSSIDRFIDQGKLTQQTMSSSMPQMTSNVINVSKQPQSFPDRIALLQKQKQMEESKAFARSSFRALKVSSVIYLCTC